MAAQYDIWEPSKWWTFYPNGVIRFCPVWSPYREIYAVSVKFHIGER